MKQQATISEVLRPLDEVKHQMYISNIIQVADILEYILEYTGQAQVKMTSFSISEEFLRRIFFIRKKGLVNDLEITLDFKATQKTLMLWPFIRQTVEKCFLADNHSKCLIVIGKDRSAAVIMSQNLTRGNRYECGSVTSDQEQVNVLLSQYREVIKNHSIPFNDIYTRRIDRN